MTARMRIPTRITKDLFEHKSAAKMPVTNCQKFVTDVLKTYHQVPDDDSDPRNSVLASKSDSGDESQSVPG